MIQVLILKLSCVCAIMYSTLFMWILYVLPYVRAHTSIETFEGRWVQWKTTDDGPLFHIVNGSSGPVPGAPAVDATLGTKEGKYCIASYEAATNSSWLFSSCFLPSNPRCTMRFSGFLNLGPGDEFFVCAMKQCDMCQPLRYENTCLYRQSFNRTDTWQVIEVPIGFLHTPFDISFGVSFLHPGSFVALDNIEILDCQAEPAKEKVCGKNALFRCNYSKKCIARDQLCDLQSDCDCGEDETKFCDTIPPEGLVTLDDCTLENGSCLWYNVHQGKVEQLGGQDFSGQTKSQWKIGSTANNTSLHEEHFTGPYMYVDLPAATTKHSAILRSVSLKPRHFGGGSCQVRFNYRVSSRKASLQLMLIEVGKGVRKKPVRTRTIWKNPGDRKEQIHGALTPMDSSFTSKSAEWNRVVVDLNTSPINASYVLQFQAEGVQGLTTPDGGEAMLHSLTLGKDCFTPDISISTCGAVGTKGPSQAMCDRHYQTAGTVDVIEAGHMTGVQTWTVPETEVYRIQVYGARGGWSILGKNFVKNSRAAKVTATFDLKAGTLLHFLVGQAGLEPCPSDVWNKMLPFCKENASFADGGGGGGGGSTVVYKQDDNGDLQVLVVAGGGGGLPNRPLEKTQVHVYPDSDRAGGSSKTATDTDTTAFLMGGSDARRLLQGRLEGASGCSQSSRLPHYWGGAGGFGAGRGACSGGGNGGGGPRASSKRGHKSDVGLPGRCFVHTHALSSSIETDSHGSDGLVEVESLWYCPCAYRCMWQGPGLDRPICLCPKGKVLQRDGSSCAAASSTEISKDGREEDSEKDDHYIILAILAVIITLAIAFAIFCVCRYGGHRGARNGLPIPVKKTTQWLCPCLKVNGRPLTFNSHILPQITHPPAVMHENSIYNRVTTKCTDQILNEVPRKHLTLIRELGQGAFGEVFYGLLSHMPMVDGDLPVAVKTLPALCTEQTEMDFLLEALIVSKFNHPNIVKFIGTCFDQHPHYLILELLEGGDLKTFLHQARPKRCYVPLQDAPVTTIGMIDLLRLSLDIARGCQHLEEKHFIHRDIAARNCLLTTKGPNRMAKIADFGMARDIYRSDYYKKAGRAMLPVKWMPPEAFLDGIFTSKTDVWSYGILLWEIFSMGHMPYPGYSNEEVMNMVTEGTRLEPPVGCPASVNDIMASCWSGIAEARPKFALIISVLERTIQDDETSSQGLPVNYKPPLVYSKRSCVRDSSTFPMDSSNGACYLVSDQGSSTSRQSSLQVNFEKEQRYLEPLLSHRSDSSTSKHAFFKT